MDHFDRLQRAISVVLVSTLLLPAVGFAAPKKGNPAVIQDKIVKLGVGRWVCVDETNGLALFGRITGIGDQSFGMQLQNYPEITDVPYADVIRVRGAGLSGKGFLAIVGLAVGGTVATALIMHHEFEANKPTLPTLPGSPVFP